MAAFLTYTKTYIVLSSFNTDTSRMSGNAVSPLPSVQRHLMIAPARPTELPRTFDPAAALLYCCTFRKAPIKRCTWTYRRQQRGCLSSRTVQHVQGGDCPVLGGQDRQ